MGKFYDVTGRPSLHFVFRRAMPLRPAMPAAQALYPVLRVTGWPIERKWSYYFQMPGLVLLVFSLLVRNFLIGIAVLSSSGGIRADGCARIAAAAIAAARICNAAWPARATDFNTRANQTAHWNFSFLQE
jgi:hypothetical protein